MPPERRNFQDALEDVIYWNSSFAIARLNDADLYHPQCLDFANRMDAEGVLSVSSEFVHNELAFHTIKEALLAEARRTGQRWQDVYRQRPEIVLSVMLQVQANRTELNRMTFLYHRNRSRPCLSTDERLCPPSDGCLPYRHRFGY